MAPALLSLQGQNVVGSPEPTGTKWDYEIDPPEPTGSKCDWPS